MVDDYFPVATLIVNNISHVRRTLQMLWKDGRGVILVTIAGGWFLSLGIRMVYPVLLPHIRNAYGMNLSTAGLLLSTLWMSYAVGQLPAGMLADKVGEGRVMMFSSLFSVGMISLIITADSVLILFLATILFGLSTALYGVARFTSLSHLYPNNDGTAIGFTMGAGDLGNTLLPPFAAFVATAISWQYGLGMAIPMFALTTVALYLLVPSRTSESIDSASISTKTISDIYTAITKPPILVITVIQVLIYMIWQAVTGFYPTYLIEMKGFQPTTASIIFGFFFALGIFIKPIAGSIYDRFGAQTPLRGMIAALIFALFALPIVEGLWSIVLITIPLSGVLGYSAITLTFLTGGLPKEIQNTSLGALRTGYMMIGALSPTVVGMLADRGLFNEAFYLLGAFAILALLMTSKISSST